ncbi:MAG: helix-turn-helix transcriptional regulator [Bacteroidota bacterium]|nr:helix-turn-helix transcriptional regulator [Bacteroidota bacterium]
MEERIKQLLEFEKMTPAEFADRIGVQRPSVSHVLSGRNKPGYVFIQKILSGFPSLNARWLLNGEGPVYEEKKESPIKETMPDLFSSSVSPENKLQESRQELKEVFVEEKLPLSNIKPPVNEPSKNLNSICLNNEKIAERIVIFYSDKTFEEYRPT